MARISIDLSEDATLCDAMDLIEDITKEYAHIVQSCNMELNKILITTQDPKKRLDLGLLSDEQIENIFQMNREKMEDAMKMCGFNSYNRSRMIDKFLHFK